MNGTVSTDILMNAQIHVDWERVIMDEIANPKMTRKTVAQTYRYLLENKILTADWARINTAITDRWSKSALVWIKEQAWSGKCLPAGDK